MSFAMILPVSPPAIHHQSKTPRALEKCAENHDLSTVEMQKLIAWIDIAIPCHGDYPVSQDNYYSQKRRTWKAREAKNIQEYLARPR